MSPRTPKVGAALEQQEQQESLAPRPSVSDTMASQESDATALLKQAESDFESAEMNLRAADDRLIELVGGTPDQNDAASRADQRRAQGAEQAELTRWQTHHERRFEGRRKAARRLAQAR
eukprot:SAG31_NODE_6931_length_1845_cov_226.393471_2_plen_119_part_00